MKNLALIAEIMGKHSNIILVSREDRSVLGAIKYITSKVNRHREIVPGKIYIPPPDGKKNHPFTDKEKFTDLVKHIKEEKVEKGLTVIFKGTSLLLSREACIRAGVNRESKISELSDREIKNLYKNWTVLS